MGSIIVKSDLKIVIKKEDLPKERLPVQKKPNKRHKSKKDYDRNREKIIDPKRDLDE